MAKKLSTNEQKFVNFMLEKSEKYEPKAQPFNVKEEDKEKIEKLTDIITKKAVRK